MSDGIVVILTLTFKPDATEAVLQGVGAMLPDTSMRPGFQSISLHRSANDPNTLLMIERWNTLEDYQNYYAWRVERGDMDALAPALAGPVAPQFFDGKAFAAL